MAVTTHSGCEEVLRKMFDYLDAELDLLTSLQINGHLAKCTGCRELLRKQRRILNAIARTAPPPADLGALRVRVLCALAGTFQDGYH